MEFSTDQAKTIFDLIRSVSPYAYPLLVSLIFPVIWIALKKLMGLSGKEATHNTGKGAWLKRIAGEITSILSLTGDKADKLVFHCCILLFFVGGITLKIGEHNEEVIRQNTLSLKNLYNESGYLFYDTGALRKLGYSKSKVSDITYNYPNTFLKSNDKIVCVDTAIKRNLFEINSALLESFLREKFKTTEIIYVDSLFQDDVQIRNVKNFFSLDIIYNFLSQAANRTRYNIAVINDKTVIIKNK